MKLVLMPFESVKYGTKQFKSAMLYIYSLIAHELENFNKFHFYNAIILICRTKELDE